MGKAADRRRDQILDAAQTLFTNKGYTQTTIEDLLAALGIARGTLYYHFTSKGEILRAIIDREADHATQRAMAVAASSLPLEAKIIGIFQAAQVRGPNAAVIATLHQHEYAAFHIQTVTSMVHALAPVLSEVITEGVQAGLFTSPSPSDDATFLLVGAFMATDQGFFPLSEDAYTQRLTSVIAAVGRVLGTTFTLPAEATSTHSPANQEATNVDTADS